MTLSNILFNNISHKLKLTLINKEKFYIKNLLNQTNQLEQIKKKYNKQISKKFNNTYNFLKQNLTVYYIINISFLKANTNIHFSDIKGKTKAFYSSGNVGLNGKQKIKRKIAITKLITTLVRESTFITNKPIALHLNNVKYYKSLIVKQLKRFFFIKIIKSYNLTSYNGCRKKKIRRKKYIKIFK